MSKKESLYDQQFAMIVVQEMGNVKYSTYFATMSDYEKYLDICMKGEVEVAIENMFNNVDKGELN